MKVVLVKATQTNKAKKQVQIVFFYK